MGRTKSIKDLKRISLHLPLLHIKVLKRISEGEDLTVAQIIRRAVELYLGTQKHYMEYNYNDLELDAHLSETRTKKAIFLSHVDELDKQKSKASGVSGEVFDDIFEELNPDAFSS